MGKLAIEFYFDFISPYSYLASTRLPEISSKLQIDLEWLPVNLPKLIKWSGNRAPSLIKNKAIYSLRDLKRWAKYLNVPFKMLKPLSFDSRPAMRTALALEGKDRIHFSHAVFNSIWSGTVDPKQQGWLKQVVELNDLPEAWLSRQNDCLDDITQQALNAGAFGAPTFFLNKRAGRPEMFFGLDHLDFLILACESMDQP